MDHPALTRRAFSRQCAGVLLAAAPLGPARAAGEGSSTGAACPQVPRPTIIWQPWASHAQLDDAAWEQLGEVAQREGYARVLLQWSRYGDTDFWPTQSPRWLESGLAHWRARKLRLILGLYMGRDYYQVLPRSDEELRAHMAQCKALCIEQAWRLLRQPPPLDVDGWYLPQEVDDLNWRRRTRERMLRDYLKGMRDALVKMTPDAANRPIYASAFFSGASTPNEFARALARLHFESGVVWLVQGGAGTGRMPDERTADYLGAIGRTLPATGWRALMELFDERHPDGQPPTFEPSSDADNARRAALWCHSTGRQPEVFFSLNQRLAKARATR